MPVSKTNWLTVPTEGAPNQQLQMPYSGLILERLSRSRQLKVQKRCSQSSWRTCILGCCGGGGPQVLPEAADRLEHVEGQVQPPQAQHRCREGRLAALPGVAHLRGAAVWLKQKPDARLDETAGAVAPCTASLQGRPPTLYFQLLKKSQCLSTTTLPPLPRVAHLRAVTLL